MEVSVFTRTSRRLAFGVDDNLHGFGGVDEPHDVEGDAGPGAHVLRQVEHVHNAPAQQHNTENGHLW